MITVSVNGEARMIAEGSALAALVADVVGVASPVGVAIARNGAVVPRTDWAYVTVEAGDAIEIVRAGQGG